MKKILLYSILFLTLTFAFIVSCNKGKKLLKCPDGYDCISDTMNLGGILPCPTGMPAPHPPIPKRFDDDSTFAYWFPDPVACPQSSPRPYVDFSIRTVVGTVFTTPDAYSDFKGANICINYDEKHIIFTSLFKTPRKKYGKEGWYNVYYSIPKMPMDYTVEYKLKNY
jgi:hypothetical protein